MGHAQKDSTKQNETKKKIKTAAKIALTVIMITNEFFRAVSVIKWE